jgi:plastocyanin/cytochrome c553
MTDQPGREPEQRLPALRPAAEPASAARFSAPASSHAFSLSPERAAGIVRQSASARWVGFIATLLVVLFVIVYYFYELGVPGVANTSRLAAETQAQQVTAVERGYQIYQANCARCHGVDGQGGVGPVLHDQSKLFVHLNPQYLRNVLFSGGRYVCGNPRSVMPIWDSANGGPFNYLQISNLIDFLRAPSDETYIVRDPSTKEPVVDKATGKVQTFTGWRDTTYKPQPGATPFPDCWTDAFKTPAGSAAPAPSGAPAGSPSATPAASGSPAASGPPAAAVIKVTALNIAFDPSAIETTMDQPFTIEFANQDAGIPHNIDIKDAGGASVFKGDIFPGVETRTYAVPALAAGSYTFICDVHPNMTGTLTVK